MFLELSWLSVDMVSVFWYHCLTLTRAKTHCVTEAHLHFDVHQLKKYDVLATSVMHTDILVAFSEQRAADCRTQGDHVVSVVCNHTLKMCVIQLTADGKQSY